MKIKGDSRQKHDINSRIDIVISDIAMMKLRENSVNIYIRNIEGWSISIN